MRFLSARQRQPPHLAVLALLGLFAFCLPSVQAQDALNRTRMLYSSSASYCAAPQVLLVNTVNLTLFPDNQTVEIALSAGSVESDVNVTIGVDVIAYSKSLLSFSLDLCSIAGGLLCPLPTYQFTGGGEYPLPSAILTQVPDIAYAVPDLEAVATLTLTSATGEEVGCIQVTLSNGNTMEQEPAKWALVGLSFLALISSLVHSIIAQSVGAAQWRVVDVFMTIQHVAITALVSVSFPQVFVSFALNFVWSIGIVTLGGLQSSLTSTRLATGGADTAVLGQALTAQLGRDTAVWLESTSSTSSGSTLDFISSLFVNLAGVSQNTKTVQQAKLPALVANTSHFQAMSPYPGTGYWKRAAALYAPNTGPGGYTVTQTSTGTLPLISNSSDTAHGGLVVLAQRAGVPAENVFMTMLVSMFIFIGIVLAAIGITLLIVALFRLLTTKSESTTSHWSRRVTRPSEVGYLVAAFMGRALLVIFPVFCIFAFYQWRFGDSWVPDFLAAIFMAFLLVAIAVFFVPLFKNARRASSNSLYYESTPPVLANRATKRWGHMAHPFRPRFFWFSLAFLVMSVARACFIGFAQGNGFVQSVGLLVLEVLFFLVLCVFRVGRDKKSDAVFIVLAIFRIASWAVCIALTERVGLTYIPRVIVGFVIVVVTGLPIIYVFIFLVVMDLVSPFRPSKLRGKHWRGERREDLQGQPAMVEKARGSSEGERTHESLGGGQSTFPEMTVQTGSSASGETSIDAAPAQTTAPPTAFSTAVNAGGSGAAHEGEQTSSRVG